jgi:hypothetical protein
MFVSPILKGGVRCRCRQLQQNAVASGVVAAILLGSGMSVRLAVKPGLHGASYSNTKYYLLLKCNENLVLEEASIRAHTQLYISILRRIP